MFCPLHAPLTLTVNRERGSDSVPHKALPLTANPRFEPPRGWESVAVVDCRAVLGIRPVCVDTEKASR